VRNLQFSEMIWGALTGQTKQNLGKILGQVPVFTHRMTDAIESRLSKENRREDDHVLVDSGAKRIIMDIPTMPKFRQYSHHHRLVIQVVNELDDPKHADALINAINDSISQEHEPRTYDSGTLFILAGRVSKEVEKEFKTNTLSKPKNTSAMENQRIAIIEKTPMAALKMVFDFLRKFYATRVRLLNEKEEKLVEEGRLTEGFFGYFADAFKGFKRYILRAVGEIAQAINSLRRQTKESKFVSKAKEKGKATITSEAIERFGDFVGPPGG